VSFLLNGAQIPGAVLRGVLRRHAPPPSQAVRDSYPAVVVNTGATAASSSIPSSYDYVSPFGKRTAAAMNESGLVSSSGGGGAVDSSSSNSKDFAAAKDVLDDSTELLALLHSMLPVVYAHSSRVELETASEAEAIERGAQLARERAAANEGKHESLFSQQPALSSSDGMSVDVDEPAVVPLDLSAEFAALRAKERATARAQAVSARQGSEADPHMENSLVPCAASSLPGFLRLLMHDWTLCQALGTPYLPLPLIDLIVEYTQPTAPRSGTAGFKFMAHWAARLREIHAESPISSTPSQEVRRYIALINSDGVTQLFTSTFPFHSKQLVRPSGAISGMLHPTQVEVFHDLSIIGEMGALLRAGGDYSSPSALWARFAERSADELRHEDWLLAEKQQSGGNNNNHAPSPAAIAMGASSEPRVAPLQDEDGHDVWDALGYDRLTSQDTSLEENRWEDYQKLAGRFGIPATVVTPAESLPPPQCSLTADDLSGEALRRVSDAYSRRKLFDLREMPSDALEAQHAECERRFVEIMRLPQHAGMTKTALTPRVWMYRVKALPIGSDDAAQPPFTFARWTQGGPQQPQLQQPASLAPQLLCEATFDNLQSFAGLRTLHPETMAAICVACRHPVNEHRGGPTATAAAPPAATNFGFGSGATFGLGGAT
jgi:hypothetical protein